MPKLPPIRSAIETIDQHASAILVWCFQVKYKRTWLRGEDGKRTGVYGMRAFLYGESLYAIVGQSEIRQRGLTAIIASVQDKLRARFDYGGMPYLGACSDVPGWEDYE